MGKDNSEGEHIDSRTTSYAGQENKTLFFKPSIDTKLIELEPLFKRGWKLLSNIVGTPIILVKKR